MKTPKRSKIREADVESVARETLAILLGLGRAMTREQRKKAAAVVYQVTEFWRKLDVADEVRAAEPKSVKDAIARAWRRG